MKKEGLIGGFESRKPWAVAIVALLLSPAIGFFYLNKGRLGLFYFFLPLLIVGALFITAHIDLRNANPGGIVDVVILAVQIIGAIHCFWVARRQAYVPPARWYARWPALLCFIAVPMLLADVVRNYGYETFLIPAGSMSPQLNAGDYILVEKFAYNHNAPARGDVIVFTMGNLTFTKRIIGLPLDTVQMKDGVLYINSTQVVRKQRGEYRLSEQGVERPTPQFVETLPEGREMLVLDKTTNDSLDNTPVHTVPAGHYFVLGDNRADSRDSRDMESVGFIPLESIVGKVVSILWNGNTRKLLFTSVY